MTRALVLLGLLATLASPAAVPIGRRAPARVRTVRVERPSGFSVRDALAGAAVTALALGCAGLVISRRPRRPTDWRQ